MGVSVIDKDFKVKGTIHVKGRLIIAGELEGTLIGDAVETMSGSRVLARAKVQKMNIGGYFEGDITAYESLKISHTGNLSGNIICERLTLEAGGRLNGHVRSLVSKDKFFPGDTASSAADTKPFSIGQEGEGASI